MIASIVVGHRSKMVDKLYDYKIPRELEDKISVGSRVIIPFSRGNKEVEGYCMKIGQRHTSRDLKEIISVDESGTVFDEKTAELIKWMRAKYLCSYLDIIYTLIPRGSSLKSTEWIVLCNEESKEKSQVRRDIVKFLKENGGGMETAVLCTMFARDIKKQLSDMVSKGILKREYDIESRIKPKYIRCAKLDVPQNTALEYAQKLASKSKVQACMLEILSSNERISVSDLIAFSQGTYNAVKALKNKELIEYEQVEVERNPFFGKDYGVSQKLTPTREQAEAINRISGAIEEKRERKFLLYGVTGSGKTEVFLQAIEKTLETGRTAIVLVPEISLTPQMTERFISRFHDRVAVLHSALSMGEKYDQWRRIRDKKADIVIGARSAVFAPLDNIGIIIIDEEHSDTYKSEMSPRYNAKEVAAFRAKQYGAALVMASATPSVESRYRAEKGEYELIKMLERSNQKAMPEIITVDMRCELERGNKSMFSKRLYDEINLNLERGEQTILLMNRRGFSTFVSCRSCGYTAECPNCNISLTYHKYPNSLKCHCCGYTRENYTECPVCGSKYIRYFGGGTQKVEDEIKKLFPAASVIRMDMDTTGKKESHEKILRAFEEDKIDILLGTQMVAKGLDFENVTLVGVMSADTMLHINDYRSGERTFALLEQVSGRAGRGEKPGRAVIQTYTPEHDAVRLVKEHNYDAFYNIEKNERAMMWYPPYCDIIGVLFTSQSETLVARAAKYFTKCIGDINNIPQRVQILGPVPAQISKIKNKYRWQLMIKCDDADEMGKLLAQAENKCREHENYKKVTVIIDKNPNLL